MIFKSFTRIAALLYLLLNVPVSIAQENNITIREINYSALSDYEGLEAAADGNMTLAVAKFCEALEYNPLNRDARLHLQIISDTKHKLISNTVAGWILHGLYALVAGEGNWRDLLARATRDADTYFPAYLVQGMGYMKLKENQKARHEFDSAITLAPQELLGYYWRGKSFLEDNQYLPAITDFSRAIAIDSSWDAAYYERGIAQSRLEEYDSAVADFQQALRRNPTLANLLQGNLEIYKAYNSRGIRRSQSNNFEAAIDDFDKALELNSLFPEPYLNRGIAYRGKGDYDLAIIDFNHALELDPANKDAYLNRAITYTLRKAPEMALKDYQHVVRMDSLNIQAYYESAEIYFKQERFDFARSALFRVMVLDSTYYWAYYWLAQILDRDKKYDQAIRYYEKFIALAPEEHYEHRLKCWERARRLKKWINRIKN